MKGIVKFRNRHAVFSCSVNRDTPTTAIGSPSASIYAPKDPGQGLSDLEVAAILELKREHPAYGPAQLRAQLKRFKGWRLSNKAIARVLRQAGYELVHRGSRPQGPEPIRFEAPRRNALWQADYTELRVGGRNSHCSLLSMISHGSSWLAINYARIPAQRRR